MQIFGYFGIYLVGLERCLGICMNIFFFFNGDFEIRLDYIGVGIFDQLKGLSVILLGVWWGSWVGKGFQVFLVARVRGWLGCSIEEALLGSRSSSGS